MGSDARRWRIEVGPVFDGPGPGDGSDAPLDVVVFEGTREEADKKARRLCRKCESRFRASDSSGCRHPDIGSFTVGASVTPVPENPAFSSCVCAERDELIPVVDAGASELRIRGLVQREWGERRELCHLTVLLIPVHSEGRKVLVQVRHREKSFPGCRDIFGGHVTAGSQFWTLLLGQGLGIDELVLASAVREANEELRVQREDGTPRILDGRDLWRVGKTAEATWDGQGNVEKSTVFLVPLRDGWAVWPMDDIRGRFERVETAWEELEYLGVQFRQHEQYALHSREKAEEQGYQRNKEAWQFADGVGRLLTDERMLENVGETIRGLPSGAFVTDR